LAVGFGGGLAVGVAAGDVEFAGGAAEVDESGGGDAAVGDVAFDFAGLGIVEAEERARLCLKTLWPHDDTESLWPLGATTRAGSVIYPKRATAQLPILSSSQ
jgi:hypothetical protein